MQVMGWLFAISPFVFAAGYITFKLVRNRYFKKEYEERHPK